MLRTKFEDHIDSNYNILEVVVHERLALPLMLFVLGFPEISSQLSYSVFPTAADSHTFIKFNSNIWKTSLPNVVLIELTLNSGSKSLRSYFKEVLHAGLRINGINVGVSPDWVKDILYLVHKNGNLTKLQGVDLGKWSCNLWKMLVDDRGFSS